MDLFPEKETELTKLFFQLISQNLTIGEISECNSWHFIVSYFLLSSSSYEVYVLSLYLQHLRLEEKLDL